VRYTRLANLSLLVFGSSFVQAFGSRQLLDPFEEAMPCVNSYGGIDTPLGFELTQSCSRDTWVKLDGLSE